MEVHDRIAQPLASVFFQLQTLESITPEGSSQRELAVGASALLREAIQHTRNIMNDLYPPLLEDGGIAALIQEEIRQFQAETGCATRLSIDCPERPPKEVEVTLYRIFHEAVTNVRRHAPAARELVVSLASRDREASLQVQDDGPGFDTEAAARGKRVGGLLSMRRRAELLGGAFDLTSIPHNGTRVEARVPLSGEDQKPEQIR